MTNEELKKKIVEIINDGIIHGEDNFGMPTSKTIENIADALIAAGIGDVKEAEHRAEVAEKAFSNCLENFLKFQYEKNCCLLDKFFLEEVNKKCLQQAEKELHEERKDD